MSYTIELSGHVNLFGSYKADVKRPISKEDAARQQATAREILARFRAQPGVILADEVGMGKTFVALAVAASVALSDPNLRPVVVMIPPSLREKWPHDFRVFRDKCLSPEAREQLSAGAAEKAVDFLKLLDDDPAKRKRIVFITHGAMSRGLTDPWVKLAVVRQALHRRRDADDLRRALCRFLGPLLRLEWAERQDPGIWEALLPADPADWLGILRRRGIDPEGDDDPETDDDPVPQAVRDALAKLDTDELYHTLQQVVPRRSSSNIEANLRRARQSIAEPLREIWKKCLAGLKFRLPLLILDEAHHLKNAQTRLASLFNVQDAEADAKEISERGTLGGVFERMLFLTATPFQLGHHELCSVLDRFDGIAWDTSRAPLMGRSAFAQRREELRDKLDKAQASALFLDHSWGQLRSDDLSVGNTVYREEDIEAWWQAIQEIQAPVATNPGPPDGSSPEAVQGGETPKSRLDRVRECCRLTGEQMKAAEEALRPWVIRHLKARTLPPPWQDVPRRRRLPGKTIDPTEAPANDSTGLAVSGDALLPFLLAARATACTPESRPVFAEGLASSYEAFMHTRRQRQGAGAPPEGDPVTDQDEIAAEPVPCDEVAQWYLDRLEKLLPLDKPGAGPTHPKLAATVRRVIELWRQGEKVVVFCHYIATGKALRRRIGEALADEISRMGAEKLRCGPREAHKELDRIGQRFFDQDSPIRRACDREISTILSRFPELERDHKQDLTDIVRRYLRTPTFLVRYFPLGGSLTAESMAQAMDAKDASDLTLRQFVTAFLEFLRDNCVPENRCRYVEAVKSIQTGSHVGSDASGSYSPDELQGERRDRLLPNVRLVNGSTQQETRQRLMLAFNTPFYPEILVASSVMAEGVDLHLNCRYVIHHDLCWNPSMLEQRTGRIDRIGAKVEQCGRPIHVYLPYVGETQDEKMYRVVMDRERWFNVVMGEKFTVDAKTTDKLARRVPLPESVANSLRFKLDVVGTGGLSQGEPALAGPA